MSRTPPSQPPSRSAALRTCDFIAQLHGIGQDPRIRDIKDLAAGSVLVVALGALVNAVIVSARG